MSLPGSPFMKTLILKHSTIPSTNTRGQDVFSVHGKRSNINHVGGSLNRHTRKHSGRFKRNSLSDKKRSSWTSSTGVVGACDTNGERQSEASSFDQQVSWRSSCGGMRKGLTCHPRDMYQQSINPPTTSSLVPFQHQQSKHPYMLSYSPSTYLEAHADRLPYVDDSTAVSPAISELDNTFTFMQTSNFLFHYPNQLSQNHCNHHQMNCNQSNLDHNHYHYYQNGANSPPPCSSLNIHSSPHSTTHSASKASQDSSLPPTSGKIGYRSLISSPAHSSHPSKHMARNGSNDPDMAPQREGTVQHYSCLTHLGVGDLTNKHSKYSNNTSMKQQINPRNIELRSCEFQDGIAKQSEHLGGVMVNSVGEEVCTTCLIDASDKRLFNHHNFNNHLNAVNIHNLIRDPNDMNNLYGEDFRSRHNSYCSHASRWSYSSHIADPVQNLRSPTPCFIPSPSRDISSHKSISILPIEKVNGAGPGKNILQQSG